MDFYHVLNRGVDKRTIFMDKRDYLRFIHNMFELNNQDRSPLCSHNFKINSDLASPNMNKGSRKLLVNIHAFCLMPNHYHIMLSPRIENGVSKFMSKLNMAYAKYFNARHERVGALFQGRYKVVPITREEHFLYLPLYIHMNPLDLFAPEWREKTIKNPVAAFEFLKRYRWSSFLDYTGNKNFPSVISQKFLFSVLGTPTAYKNNLFEHMKELQKNKISMLDKSLTIE